MPPFAAITDGCNDRISVHESRHIKEHRSDCHEILLFVPLPSHLHHEVLDDLCSFEPQRSTRFDDAQVPRFTTPHWSRIGATLLLRTRSPRQVGSAIEVRTDRYDRQLVRRIDALQHPRCVRESLHQNVTNIILNDAGQCSRRMGKRNSHEQIPCPIHLNSRVGRPLR